MLKNKTIIIVGVVMIAVLALAVYLLLINTNSNSGTQKPTPTTKGNNFDTSIINNVSPSQSQVLHPGSIQTFTIFLGKPLYIGQVKISLTMYDYTQADTDPITVPTTATFTSDNVITVKTKSPIAPHATFTLTMLTTTNNKTVLRLVYTSSMAAKSTPATDNNTALAAYLPLETDTYKLSYLPEKNTYVFNFKYNPDSALSISEQYTAAKQDAIQFIQSKGINVNSIVIEWKSN